MYVDEGKKGLRVECVAEDKVWEELEIGKKYIISDIATTYTAAQGWPPVYDPVGFYLEGYGNHWWWPYMFKIPERLCYAECGQDIKMLIDFEDNYKYDELDLGTYFE